MNVTVEKRRVRTPVLPVRPRRAARAIPRRRTNTRQPFLRRILRSAIVRTLVSCVVRAVLGFIAAQGSFAGGYAPFGAAFAAAGAGSYAGTAAGIVGALAAAAGSWVRWRMSDGLRYTAATLLAAVAVWSAQGTALCEKIWFRPLCAALSLAVVGWVMILGGEGSAVLFFCELIITWTGTAAIQQVLANFVDDRTLQSPRVPAGAAEAASAAVLLMGLAVFKLPGGFSPVRIAALTSALYCGYAGGAGAGAAVGVIFGAVAGGGAEFCVCCAFGGLASGTARGAGKLAASAMFMMSAAAAALIGTPKALTLYETAFAGSLFVLIPERRLPELALFSPANVSGTERRALEAVERRLSAISRAFGQLGEVIGSIPRPASPESAAAVFDRASARVCRRCALRSLCWERDRMNTCAVLRTLEPILGERGGVELSDLPSGFSSRCLHPELLLSAINEEMRIWQLDRISARTLERQRRAAGAQCEALAALTVCDTERTAPAPDTELRLRRALKSSGTPAVCEAWRGRGGRLCAEISGKELSRFAADRGAALSQAAGVRFAPPELVRTPTGDRLLLRESEPRGFSVGIACRRRKASPRSGDSATWFRNDAGDLVILLSDGMGSGSEAAGLGQTTVRLCEQFLRAGADPKNTLLAVSGALLMRTGDSGAFATADVCILDLFSGEGRILKCGAAPTYLRCSGKTGKVAGEELPGGLSTRPAVSDIKLRLGNCDCIVMLTDGVCDGSDDKWLCELIGRGGDARTLAARIADTAYERSGGADDLTVICVTLEERRARKTAERAV